MRAVFKSLKDCHMEEALDFFFEWPPGVELKPVGGSYRFWINVRKMEFSAFWDNELTVIANIQAEARQRFGEVL